MASLHLDTLWIPREAGWQLSLGLWAFPGASYHGFFIYTPGNQGSNHRLGLQNDHAQHDVHLGPNPVTSCPQEAPTLIVDQSGVWDPKT